MKRGHEGKNNSLNACQLTVYYKKRMCYWEIDTLLNWSKSIKRRQNSLNIIFHSKTPFDFLKMKGSLTFINFNLAQNKIV